MESNYPTENESLNQERLMQDTQAKARWSGPWWRHPFLKGVPFQFWKVLTYGYPQNSSGAFRRVKIDCVRLRFLLENKEECGSDIAATAVIILTVFLMVITGIIMAVSMGMRVVVVVIRMPRAICVMSNRWLVVVITTLSKKMTQTAPDGEHVHTQHRQR